MEKKKLMHLPEEETEASKEIGALQGRRDRGIHGSRSGSEGPTAEQGFSSTDHPIHFNVN